LECLVTTKSPRSNQCGGVGNSSGKSGTEFVVGTVVGVVVDVEFGGGSDGGDGGALDGAAVAASIVGAGAVAEISGAGRRAGDRAEISSGAWSGPSSRSKTDGVGANPALNSGVATP